MKNKILKNNNRGFVLLYTMAISSVILAVALGIANIALKEAKFSTSARATNEAFFAADTGAECALFYDKLDPTQNAFSGGTSFIGPMSCANQDIALNPIATDSWSFEVTDLGNSGRACAIVTLTKDLTIPLTTIISKGSNNCMSSSNRVERELKVTY